MKAVDPNFRGTSSSQQIVYTLSRREFSAAAESTVVFMSASTFHGGFLFPGHEEHLIPYSLVRPIKVETKRPVIFAPSLLSRGLIERLLQPAESGLRFSACQPGEQTLTPLLDA